MTLKVKFNINSYTYKFLSDGKVVSEGSGLYGSTIPYPSNPIKEDTNGQTYKFVSWDKTDTILNGDIVFNAIFEEVNKEYTYKFMEEFSDRIFYATDIHDPENINPDNPSHEMLYLSEFLDKSCEEGHISYEAYEKICRKNALKLLGESED